MKTQTESLELTADSLDKCTPTGEPNRKAENEIADDCKPLTFTEALYRDQAAYFKREDERARAALEKRLDFEREAGELRAIRERGTDADRRALRAKFNEGNSVEAISRFGFPDVEAQRRAAEVGCVDYGAPQVDGMAVLMAVAEFDKSVAQLLDKRALLAVVRSLNQRHDRFSAAEKGAVRKFLGSLIRLAREIQSKTLLCESLELLASLLDSFSTDITLDKHAAERLDVLHELFSVRKPGKNDSACLLVNYAKLVAHFHTWEASLPHWKRAFTAALYSAKRGYFIDFRDYIHEFFAILVHEFHATLVELCSDAIGIVYRMPDGHEFAFSYDDIKSQNYQSLNLSAFAEYANSQRLRTIEPLDFKIVKVEVLV